TEDVIVFDVLRASRSGWQDVQAAIEVADPEAALAVDGERGNIAIRDGRLAGHEHLLPAPTVGFLLGNRGPRENPGPGFAGDDLLHCVQLPTSETVVCGKAVAGGQRQVQYALVLGANQELFLVVVQRGNQRALGKDAGEPAAVKLRNAHGSSDIGFVACEGD